MADKIEAVISFLRTALYRNGPDLAAMVLVLLIQAAGVYTLLKTAAVRARPWLRRGVLVAASLASAFVLVGFFMMFVRVARYFPDNTATWLRGSAMIWGMLCILEMGAWLLWQALRAGIQPERSQARRNFLKVAGGALVAAPMGVTGYGVFVQRVRLRVREQNIVIPGLAADLDGLRIVQLTDIHLSPFLSEKELARAVAMANETRANLALVTGDMISSSRDPLELCLRHLSGLRSDAGIYGCMGNHEIYAKVENYATELGARLGIHYLRSQNVPLKFGAATLNLAGVDYQHFHEPYLVGADAMVQPGVLNVLMSHNPDVFPVAARQGYDLTIAGHTHGGQVRVEILREDLNVARFFTPFIDGLYREGDRSIFVSRGIGTIGLPVRLGAPPEVALLRLCRS